MQPRPRTSWADSRILRDSCLVCPPVFPGITKFTRFLFCPGSTFSGRFLCSETAVIFLNGVLNAVYLITCIV